MRDIDSSFINVLLVDDEAIPLKYLNTLIDWEAEGFHICAQARSVAQALEFLHNFAVDVVFFDVYMQEESGVSLSVKIATQFPHITMIAISSYDDYDFVREILKNGAQDYILKHRLSAEVLISLLNAIKTDTRYTVGNHKNIVVRRARQFIENNYKKNITLETAARFVGVNSSYLSRVFHAETGQTFKNMLTSVRIKISKQMLKEGISLKEIAADCGFKNYNYFFKVFKDVENITPVQFQERLRAQPIISTTPTQQD